MMLTASYLYPTDMHPNQGSENVSLSGGGWVGGAPSGQRAVLLGF